MPTPHLDRLAAEGLRFTDAHSPSSVCTPTRYGLLTGRYAWRTALKKSVLWPWDPPLLEDPGETRNLFRKHPEVVEPLRRRLDRIRAAGSSAPAESR